MDLAATWATNAVVNEVLKAVDLNMLGSCVVFAFLGMASVKMYIQLVFMSVELISDPLFLATPLSILQIAATAALGYIEYHFVQYVKERAEGPCQSLLTQTHVQTLE